MSGFFFTDLKITQGFENNSSFWQILGIFTKISWAKFAIIYIKRTKRQTEFFAFFEELPEQILKILISGNSYDQNSSKLWIGFCPGPQGGQPQLFY